MDPTELDRIALLLKELEAMCQRAKELRAELDAARKEGRFWRSVRDVKKSSTHTDFVSEAADTKANLN